MHGLVGAQDLTNEDTRSGGCCLYGWGQCGWVIHRLVKLGLVIVVVGRDVVRVSVHMIRIKRSYLFMGRNMTVYSFLVFFVLVTDLLNFTFIHIIQFLAAVFVHGHRCFFLTMKMKSMLKYHDFEKYIMGKRWREKRKKVCC